MFNLTLAGFAKKTDLDYETYEKVVGNAQNWFMYQKSLLDVLYKISDLRYTLHLGAVSREQCIAILPTYTKQVQDTQSRLAAWHEGTTERLKIDTDEARRKRAGFDGVIHFLPGLFDKDFMFILEEQSITHIHEDLTVDLSAIDESLEEFKSYQYDKIKSVKTGIDSFLKDQDHSIDASRYLFIDWKDKGKLPVI